VSDEKNFFARWSRRKLDAEIETLAQSHSAKRDNVVVSELPAASPVQTSAFDVASLPAIDSIGAGSDIRAFLEVGVPADLTRAALRRVWLTDPTIRSFVGLSENSWDFNAAGAIPGFGAMNPQSVANMVTRILGGPNALGTEKESLKLPEPSEDPLLASAPIEGSPTEVPSGMRNPSQVPQEGPSVVAAEEMLPDDEATTAVNSVSCERVESKVRRQHGGALPQFPVIIHA
jgi:uncharacterized protein DUF3306